MWISFTLATLSFLDAMYSLFKVLRCMVVGSSLWAFSTIGGVNYPWAVKSWLATHAIGCGWLACVWH